MHHLIQISNLRETHWQEQSAPALAAGQARLQIEAFALTANNVTYATFGGAPMHYWNFFPTQESGYGRVPVWGFAKIIESQLDGVEVGRRVYGYFPISDTLDVEPVRVSEAGFMDGAAHRADLSPIYNTYSFTDTDPAYKSEFEAEQMLFRPLYLTGWMICDSLMQGTPVPDAVILSSASSKTALATAHGLQRRGIKTIGLTSPGNVDFVKESGLYTETLTYDEIAHIATTGTLAYVDFVGRPALTHALHTHCGSALGRSLMIGATDWEVERTPLTELPGPEPEFFFVPSYAAERAKQLPKGELDRTMLQDLIAFYPISKRFVTPETVQGAEAIASSWVDTVDGKISPTRGLICSL